MTSHKRKAIRSLAAPTPAEEAVLMAMSPEERKALLAEKLAEGERDIAAGRYTEFRSESELRKYFDELLAADEVKAV